MALAYISKRKRLISRMGKAVVAERGGANGKKMCRSEGDEGDYKERGGVWRLDLPSNSK
jgi:hypothetical protein